MQGYGLTESSVAIMQLPDDFSTGLYYDCIVMLLQLLGLLLIIMSILIHSPSETL